LLGTAKQKKPEKHGLLDAKKIQKKGEWGKPMPPRKVSAFRKATNFGRKKRGDRPSKEKP